MPKHILILSGTNRPGANTLKMARVAENLYREAGCATDFYSLEELPAEIFDSRSYARKPESFLAVQQRILDAAGLHVVTPEYNGSFPGVLKYFIDMLKFPQSFEHKPVAFTGVAAGVWGALRAVEQLQLIFGYRNAYLFPERVFVPAVAAQFDPQGRLLDPALQDRLLKQTRGFAEFAFHFAPQIEAAEEG